MSVGSGRPQHQEAMFELEELELTGVAARGTHLAPRPVPGLPSHAPGSASTMRVSVRV